MSFCCNVSQLYRLTNECTFQTQVSLYCNHLRHSHSAQVISIPFIERRSDGTTPPCPHCPTKTCTAFLLSAALRSRGGLKSFFVVSLVKNAKFCWFWLISKSSRKVKIFKGVTTTHKDMIGVSLWHEMSENRKKLKGCRSSPRNCTVAKSPPNASRSQLLRNTNSPPMWIQAVWLCIIAPLWIQPHSIYLPFNNTDDPTLNGAATVGDAPNFHGPVNK